MYYVFISAQQSPPIHHLFVPMQDPLELKTDFLVGEKSALRLLVEKQVVNYVSAYTA